MEKGLGRREVYAIQYGVSLSSLHLPRNLNRDWFSALENLGQASKDIF